MPQPFDLLIRHAAVYDGSGAPARDVAVGLRADRIAAIGPLDDAGAARTIDATGLALAPGFIDVHAHDDLLVLRQPEVRGKTMQGVTTTIVGNCGTGVAPYASLFATFNLDPDRAGAALPEWDGYGGYFARLEADPPSLNVAALVGHGTIRHAAMGGMARRPAGEGEAAQMRAALLEGLQAGAVGMSTGLIYEPGRYAPTDEIVALAKELTPAGAVYTSHMRNEGAGLLDAIRETIGIGEAAGCAVQISHHKASGSEQWGRVRESLAMIDEARARGLDLSADQYPYTAGSTSLFAIVQNGAFGGGDGGTEGIGTIDATDVLIASAPRHASYEGQTIAALADSWDLPVNDAVQRLLDEEGRAMFVVLFSMDEADVRTVLQHPSTMIGTDGIDAGSRPHPRMYGAYPRILGRYVREAGLLTLEAAIHKMTGMPAAKFHLPGRGRIEVGAFADLVLFDPATVLDRATYEDPRRPPAGLPHVFVNGVAVVRDGEHTGARPGRPLRRGVEA